MRSTGQKPERVLGFRWILVGRIQNTENLERGRTVSTDPTVEWNGVDATA
jgi:hypothetical protein